MPPDIGPDELVIFSDRPMPLPELLPALLPSLPIGLSLLLPRVITGVSWFEPLPLGLSPPLGLSFPELSGSLPRGGLGWIGMTTGVTGLVMTVVTGAGSTVTTLVPVVALGELEPEPVFCAGDTSVRFWRSVGVVGWLHGQVGPTEAKAEVASEIDRPRARSMRRLAVRAKSLLP